MDVERRPGIAAVGHSVLEAAEPLLLVAHAEHTEQELKAQSLLCCVALEVVVAVLAA